VAHILVVATGCNTEKRGSHLEAWMHGYKFFFSEDWLGQGCFQQLESNIFQQIQPSVENNIFFPTISKRNAALQ
jgi:hypothetical protein